MRRIDAAIERRFIEVVLTSLVYRSACFLFQGPQDQVLHARRTAKYGAGQQTERDGPQRFALYPGRESRITDRAVQSLFRLFSGQRFSLFVSHIKTPTRVMDRRPVSSEAVAESVAVIRYW